MRSSQFDERRVRFYIRDNVDEVELFSVEQLFRRIVYSRHAEFLCERFGLTACAIVECSALYAGHFSPCR